MADTPTAPKIKKPRRRRRWIRRLLILALVLVGGYYLLMQSFLTRWIIMGQIGKQVGGTATASSVILSPSGKVVIRDAKLRAPGVPGEAGTVVSVKRLEAEFDWSSLFGGGLAIHRIELDEPLARISQSIDDGTVNIAALSPPKNTKPPKEVPKILVRGGTIELGEHVTDPARVPAGTPSYSPLKRIAVGGEVIESPSEQGAKVFSFHEVEGAKPVAGGLAVQGRISKEGIRLTLEGLSLSTWTADATPTASRELFGQLNVQGEIPRAVITYAYAGGWDATIALRNVAINLPVYERPDEDEDGNIIPPPKDYKPRRLRMQKVNGDVTFTNRGVTGNVKGLLEEFPYEVTFHVDGTSFDSPFTCTLESKGFALRKNPQIMKFAPGVARRRFDQFNNPTGTVDAKVTVTRGSPVNGKEADVKVAGRLHFSNTVAAFEKFPYRFSDITGDVTFDDNEVNLVSIDGLAPNGVKIHASGVIAPPNDDAGVELDIRVSNIPVDEKLRQAMLGRRRVLDAIFSESRFQELLDKGLIATPVQHDQAAAALSRLPADQADSDEAARLRAVTNRPVFELGGRAEVHVQIHREVGPGKEWEDVETISIGDAGVLPESVPYPLLADQVVIVKKDTLATVEGGFYRGLTGGYAGVSAKADFSQVDNPQLPFVPDVEITARDIPVNALLINSLPESEQLGASLHQEMTDMHAAGLVDCDIKLGMQNGNDPYFNVDATLQDLLARPHTQDAPPRVKLSNLRGHVIATQDKLALDLSALAGRADGSTEATPATIRFSMPIVARLSELAAPHPAPTRGLELNANASGLDSSLPVEDMVSIFAPAAGKNLDALRSRFDPFGLADVNVAVTQPPGGGDTATRVDASNLQAIEITALGGRVGLQSTQGALSISANTGPAPAVVSTEGLSGTLLFQGEPVGSVTAKGRVASDGGNVPGAEGMAISLKSARFESPLTKSAARTLGPASIADFLEKATVKGAYDLDAMVGAPPGPGTIPAPEASGVLRPTSLEMVIDGTPVAFTTVSGSIDFGGGDGRLHALRVTAPDWSAAADGAWITVPTGATALQSTLSVTSNGLPKDLLAVLPDDLRAVFDQLSFSATGPVELSEGQLSLTFGDSGVDAFKATGRVTLSGGKMDVGASVDRVVGTLDFSASRTTSDVPPDFEVWALLDGFTLSGVNMTNGRVRAASGVRGEILVPLISADCHGGRIAGSATISPPDNGKRRYEATLEASDVRFASVLADFQSVAPHDPTQTPLQQLPDESRGRLDMGMSLAGIVGDPDSRRGRGTATVGGGRIVNIPLLVPLIRLTNLQLPISERLDYAYADFYIQARQMIFDELSISSKTVSVYGYGVATLPDLGLNLRFQSKSQARIPVITGLFEFLRNELVTVVVTGTLSDPHMGVSPLSGAAKVLTRIFSGTPTPEQRTLDRIERRAEQDPRRPLHSGAGPVEPR